MCAVIGYVGKDFCKNFIIEGLSRLEYRGYDSAGFACLSTNDSRLQYVKTEGKLNNLIEKLNYSPIDGNVGIGHTRWSTHGIVSQQNAHPQFDCQKTISIVHNGIVENHHELRKQLQFSGHVFHSETDTEVIAHFLEALLISHRTFKGAVVDLVNNLDGAYAFICLIQDFPDQVVVVRKRSPLCIGIGDGEMFIASDALAFAGRTNKIIFMPDESFAIIKKDMVNIFDFAGNPLTIEAQEINIDWSVNDKKGYELFMLKEIYEQKNSISNSVSFFNSLGSKIWDHLGITPEYVKNLKTINIFACGTSWHAARIAQFFFEKICGIPTKILLASEFRYMTFFPEKDSLYIAVSQSGETADTLEGLRLIKSFGCQTMVITNVASSTMVREADGFLLTQAGPEVAVASTKSFSSQLTALYWLANHIGVVRESIPANSMEAVESDLLVCAEVLENCIENYKLDIIHTLAEKYSKFKNFIFLGRDISYPLALEGALKLKEISYIFCHAYPAGELKHGPIALIDEKTPVILFSNLNSVIYQKLVANAQEVKARKGHLIIFAFEDQNELISLADQLFIIPKVNPLLAPLAMTGLMQFFIYQIAKTLGCPIDKPRNLAKSVTVE